MASTDVVAVLERLDVRIHNVGRREVSAFCPVHEKYAGRPNVHTPAFSMNVDTGAWICYSCGAKGSILALVSELSGDSATMLDVVKLTNEAKLQQFVEKTKAKEDEHEDEIVVDEFTYARFPEVPSKMAATRKLDQDLLWKYGVRYNPDHKAWVLPIYSEGGVLMGWQEKAKGWVRNYPKGVEKSKTLFGLHRFAEGTAILVESPLDVVRMHTAGVVGGLASFGVYVSQEQLDLLGFYADKLIIALDNDSAGISMGRQLRRSSALPRFRYGVLWFAYPKDSAHKDPGDMAAGMIREAVENASIRPWWLA